VITVIVDDLAFLAVDAVVRPADESLAPLTKEGSRLDPQAGDRGSPPHSRLGPRWSPAAAT
jgi:hypothetical protein